MNRAIILLIGAAAACGGASRASAADFPSQVSEALDRAARGETVTTPQELAAMLRRVSADAALKDAGASDARDFVSRNAGVLRQECQGDPACEQALSAASARAAAAGDDGDDRRKECEPADQVDGDSQSQLDNLIACAAKGDASATPEAVEAAMKQAVVSGDFTKDLKSAYALYVALDRNFDALDRACQGRPECRTSLRAAYRWSLSQKFALQGGNPIFDGARFGAVGVVPGFLRAMASAGGDYRAQERAWSDLGDCVTQLCGGGFLCRLKAYVVVARAKDAWYGPAASDPSEDRSSREDPDMTIWGR